MKKNWGFGSKGISLRSFPVDSFGPGTFVDHLALVSFMKRDHEVHQYSVKAPARRAKAFIHWTVEELPAIPPALARLDRGADQRAERHRQVGGERS